VAQERARWLGDIQARFAAWTNAPRAIVRRAFGSARKVVKTPKVCAAFAQPTGAAPVLVHLVHLSRRDKLIDRGRS
jgi:hypothetical protein